MRAPRFVVELPIDKSAEEIHRFWQDEENNEKETIENVRRRRSVLMGDYDNTTTTSSAVRLSEEEERELETYNNNVYSSNDIKTNFIHDTQHERDYNVFSNSRNNVDITSEWHVEHGRFKRDQEHQQQHGRSKRGDDEQQNHGRFKRAIQQSYEIETAVFVDSAMYKFVSDRIDDGEDPVESVEDIVFSIMNGVRGGRVNGVRGWGRGRGREEGEELSVD